MQHGAAAVEFALVLVPFLLLLLGVIEIGRLLYLWNTVQEVTRSAARQAVVSNFRPESGKITEIKRLAVFRSSLSGGALPGSSEITDLSVSIKYLNKDGTEIPSDSLPINPGDNISACTSADRINVCIKFVEVSVCSGDPCSGVSFNPITGLFLQDGPFSTDLTGLSIPLSTVRMPAESLGFVPAG